MKREWSDILVLVWNSILGPVGFILNLILLVVTVKSTPSAMTNYAILIRVSIFFDIAMSAGQSLSTLRLLPTSNSVFALFQGPCTLCFTGLITSRICLYMYSLQVTCLISSHFMLTFSYYYRQRVVTMTIDKFNNTHLKMFYYIFLLTSIIFFHLVYFTSLSSKEEIDERANEVLPGLTDSTWIYIAVFYNGNPIQIAFEFLSIYTGRVTIFVAAVCWFRVSRAMKTIQVSEYSKTLNKALLHVLLCQTIVPLLSTVTALIFTAFVYIPELRTTTVQNIMVLPASLMPVFSAFFSLYFISPYRKAMKSVLGRSPRTSTVSVPVTIA